MKHFIIIFFLFSLGTIFSQTLEKQIAYIEHEANLVFNDKSYRDALPYYEYLDSVAPNNPSYNYRVGVCQYELGGLHDAVESFEKAKLYGEDSPKLNFYLGRLYHKTNKFDEAEREYITYRDGLDDPEEQKEMNHYIAQCEAAIELLKDELQLRIQNVGSTVNSNYADYVPLTDAEEKVMIFTSRRKGGASDKVASDGEYYEDIYMSRKMPDGKWGKPRNLEAINDKFHNASVSISADATKIYFYESGKKKSDLGIYESKYELNTQGVFDWSKPKKLNDKINMPETHTPSVSISSDGKKLYLSSDRAGGFGGLDLYVSELDEKGDWGLPRNLGETVNTEYDEDSPFIHNSGEVLFYSSKGHLGMGGYDVFFSRKQEDGTWGSAVNFGAPVNSTNDDVFFNWTADESKGFYSTQRTDGYGEKDIYVIRRPFDDPNITVLKGFVEDVISGNPVKAMVVVMDAKTKEVINQTTTDSNGRYMVHLEEEKEYSIKVEAEGYVLDEEDIYIPKEYGYYEMKDDIKVIPYGKEDLEVDSVVVYKAHNEGDVNVDKLVKQAASKKIIEHDFLLGDLAHFRDSISRILSSQCCVVMATGDLFTIVGDEKDLGEYGFPMSVYSLDQLNDITDSLLKAYDNDLSQPLYAHGNPIDVIDFLDEHELAKGVTDGALVKVGDTHDYKIAEEVGEEKKDKKVVLNVSDIKMSPKMQEVFKDNGILVIEGNEAVMNVTQYNTYTDSINSVVTEDDVLVINDEGELETKAKTEDQYVVYKDGEAKDLKEVIEDINAYNDKVSLPEGSKIVMRDILFAFDSHKLTPASKEALREVAKIFNDHPYVRAEISGHTDNVGSDNYNLKLSKKRARSVAKYLIKIEKVSKDRIVAVGKGESTPYASNGTIEGKKLNRRTELKVIGEVANETYHKDELVDLSTFLEQSGVSYSDENSPLVVEVKKDYVEGELLPWKVHFPFNQWASITPYSAGKVKKVIDYMNKHPKAHLMIHSHADPLGNFHENKALAGRRGQTVFAYLIENGIDASRLTVNSYGSEAPLVQTENVQQNVVNRRVEFEVIH